MLILEKELILYTQLSVTFFKKSILRIELLYYGQKGVYSFYYQDFFKKNGLRCCGKLSKNTKWNIGSFAPFKVHFVFSDERDEIFN